MKKICIFCIFLIILCVGCNKQPQKAVQTETTKALATKTTETFTLSKEQKETLTSFFKYFSEKNYEKMKDFCSKDYVTDFFHKDDVFGFKSASLVSYDESNIIIHDKEYWLPIVLKGEATEDSSNYVEGSKFEEVGYDAILEQQTDGTWLITGITSG